MPPQKPERPARLTKNAMGKTPEEREEMIQKKMYMREHQAVGRHGTKAETKRKDALEKIAYWNAIGMQRDHTAQDLHQLHKAQTDLAKAKMECWYVVLELISWEQIRTGGGTTLYAALPRKGDFFVPATSPPAHVLAPRAQQPLLTKLRHFMKLVGVDEENQPAQQYPVGIFDAPMQQPGLFVAARAPQQLGKQYPPQQYEMPPAQHQYGDADAGLAGLHQGVSVAALQQHRGDFIAAPQGQLSTIDPAVLAMLTFDDDEESDGSEVVGAEEIGGLFAPLPMWSEMGWEGLEGGFALAQEVPELREEGEEVGEGWDEAAVNMEELFGCF